MSPKHSLGHSCPPPALTRGWSRCPGVAARTEGLQGGIVGTRWARRGARGVFLGGGCCSLPAGGKSSSARRGWGGTSRDAPRGQRGWGAGGGEGDNGDAVPK